MKHQVKPDEDIFTIAEKYYGDASYWNLIYYANEEILGDDLENLPVGTFIEIPIYIESEEKFIGEELTK